MPRVAPLLVWTLTVAGCGGLAGSSWPEPERAFDVRIQGEDGSQDSLFDQRLRFRTEVVDVRERVEQAGSLVFSYTDLALREPGWVLTLFSRDLPPAGLVAEGRSYDFSYMSRRQHFASLPAVEVRDEQGLVFFGVTDTDPERALSQLPEGWVAELEDAGLPTRMDPCGVDHTPLALRIGHGEHQMLLQQGQKAALGSYTVHCLVSRAVDRRANRCPGNPAPAVSLVIRRR